MKHNQIIEFNEDGKLVAYANNVDVTSPDKNKLEGSFVADANTVLKLLTLVNDDSCASIQSVKIFEGYVSRNTREETLYYVKKSSLDENIVKNNERISEEMKTLSKSYQKLNDENYETVCDYERLKDRVRRMPKWVRKLFDLDKLV